MKNFSLLKTAAMLCAASAIVSCRNNASVKGTVTDAPESDVIVKLLDINRYQVLDTISTDKNGKFSYKVDVRKGDPEFIYLFHGDTKIASMLLNAGDKVMVEADTLGHFSVSGSEETERLVKVETDFSAFLSRFAAQAERMEAAEARKAMSEEYVRYYRTQLKYVMQNPFSLTVVPVLFQMITPELPVFAQPTDAIHFRNISDSLETVYPDSRYVKALRQEADRRGRLLELNMRLQNADEMNYPEIELPDLNGVKRKLSEVDAKVVLLYFWTPSEAAQKMFNLDELAPVYKDYKSRGLEIYQVAVETDKALWARVVKDQKLGWINVCDGLGTASPAVGTYNVSKLPTLYVIHDGRLVDGSATDERSLRQLLDKYL
ncbi:MAG: AhpC/TSA family protein [Clostridium sp.]|nr:AhpC/TSA family protein [Bacteroides sp.]MCM1198008.1 AhpC/TSA family protein [Clostridium sp.]